MDLAFYSCRELVPNCANYKVHELQKWKKYQVEDPATKCPPEPSILIVEVRCRTNMAHIRQSRPDSGLGRHVRFLKPFQVFPLRLKVVADPFIRGADFVRTSTSGKHSDSVKIITHLDHISHCKTASGRNRSNRRTYRVSIMNARCVEILGAPSKHIGAETALADRPAQLCHATTIYS